jgi:phage-related minor tail protein
MEARGEARQQVRQEKGFFAPLTGEGRAREKELFEEIKAAKIKEALDIREAKILEDKQQKTEKITENINNSANKADKLGKNLKKAEEPTKKIEEKTKATTTAIESTVTTSDFLNEKLGQTSFLVTDLALGSQKFAEELLNVKSEADILNEKFMEIGQSVEQGIVSNLTDAVMGTQSLADAAINVLNDLKRKLVEVAMQRAVSGIGSKIGGFFGNLFGGGKKSSGGGFLGGANAFTGGGGGISPLLGFANGGRPPVGKASIVGERGPEIFVPTSSGTIIPNNMIGGGGGVTNMVTVNVDASGAPQVQGSTAEANQLGQLIGQAIQEQLVKEKRPGGLLT